jgi:hypothetical protein
MVYTEVLTVPMNSRGYILRNRDTINAEHNIKIFFPRNKARNGYQEMVMEGLKVNIKAAMSKIRSILEEASAQYEEYKMRQERRRLTQTKKTVPTISADGSKKTTQKNGNVFQALNGLFEQEEAQAKSDYEARVAHEKETAAMEEAISNGTVPRPKVVKVAAMNFAAMAAKAPTEKKTHVAKAPSAPKKVKLNVVPSFIEIEEADWFDWSEE